MFNRVAEVRVIDNGREWILGGNSIFLPLVSGTQGYGMGLSIAQSLQWLIVA